MPARIESLFPMWGLFEAGCLGFDSWAAASTPVTMHPIASNDADRHSDIRRLLVGVEASCYIGERTQCHRCPGARLPRACRAEARTIIGAKAGPYNDRCITSAST